MTNQTPQEILRSMPGINSKNYRLIMNRVENLQELSKMKVEAIQEIIGQEHGNKLYNFIHNRG
jgi:DNA excision repair protein ERCC-4